MNLKDLNSLNKKNNTENVSTKVDASVSPSAVIRNVMSSGRNGETVVYVPLMCNKTDMYTFIKDHCNDEGDALGNKPFYSFEFIRVRLPATMGGVSVTEVDRELIEDISPETIAALEIISKKVFTNRSFTAISKAAKIIVKKYNTIKGGITDGYDKKQQKDLDSEYQKDLNDYLIKEDLGAKIIVRHLTLHAKMPNKSFSYLSIPNIKYVGFDKILYNTYCETLKQLRSRRGNRSI